MDFVYRNATVEDVSVILNSIGILEHRSEHSRGTHTFFADSTREVNRLLDMSKVAADGLKPNFGCEGGLECRRTCASPHPK